MTTTYLRTISPYNPWFIPSRASYLDRGLAAAPDRSTWVAVLAAYTIDGVGPAFGDVRPCHRLKLLRLSPATYASLVEVRS